jgi:hypothetical protein
MSRAVSSTKLKEIDTTRCAAYSVGERSSIANWLMVPWLIAGAAVIGAVWLW